MSTFGCNILQHSPPHIRQETNVENACVTRIYYSLRLTHLRCIIPHGFYSDIFASGNHPPTKEPRRAIALLERAVTLGSVRAINSLSGANETAWLFCWLAGDCGLLSESEREVRGGRQFATNLNPVLNENPSAFTFLVFSLETQTKTKMSSRVSPIFFVL